MSHRSPSAPRARRRAIRCASPASSLASAAPGVGAAPALAEALPGLGRRALPLHVGPDHRPARRRRAALPRGGRRGPGRRRLRRRPAQLRGAAVQRRGRLRDAVGLLRGRPRPVRADRGTRHRRRRATSMWSTPATTGSRSSTPAATSSPPGAIRGSGTRRLQLRLLTEPHRPPGRRHRGGGQLRLRGRQRQRPHRALQPRRRRSDAVGHPTAAGPGSSPTPAGVAADETRGDRQRRQPPHPEIRPQRRLRRLGGLRRQGARDSSASPTASRSMPPATSTSPTTQPPRGQARPASPVPRRMGRVRLQTGTARVPAGARQRSGGRHLRG